MPNIMISGLPLATLPLDGPNSFFEVQTIEAGVEVSRKVASDDLTLNAAITIEEEGVPLVTGADTLNFVGAGVTASGAGSTKTITIPMTGQVNTVVGGTNINVDAGDPINPIVNLDAAITGVSVNAVTLDAGGVATNYLDETGAYSVPAGSVIPGTVTGSMLAYDGAVYAEETTLTYLLNVDITGSGVFGNELQIANSLQDNMGITFQGPVSNAHIYYDESTDELFEQAQNHRLISNTVRVDNELRIGAVGDDLQIITSGGGTSMRLITNTAANRDLEILAANGARDLHLSFGTGLLITEKAAQHSQNAGEGQWWVRNDVPNVPMFTDDTGVDFVLNAAGSIPDPLIIGSINLTSAEVVSTTGTPYDNVPINIGANLVGTQGMTQLARQNIQTKPSAFGFNSTLFININGAGTAGSDTIIGGLNSAQLEVEFGVAVRMQHGLVGTEVFVTDAAGIRLPVGSMYVTEKAAAAGDVGGDGQFWVRNDSPNTPMFTTDTGVDIDLSAGGVSFPLDALDNEQIRFGTGQDFLMDFDGTNMLFEQVAGFTIWTSPAGGKAIELRDGNTTGAGAAVNISFADQVGTVQAVIGTGIIVDQFAVQSQAGQLALISGLGGLFPIVCDALSIQLEEKAAPGTNVAGYGQYWVRSSAPNRPTFTDDTDVDQLLDPSISEIVSVVASRTLVLEDKGKTIGFTGGTVAQTMTIPASGSVAYQIGTVIAFDNSGSVSFDIAITTDTLIFADNNGTGTRTLAAGGYAAAQKVGATTWKISGANIT